MRDRAAGDEKGPSDAAFNAERVEVDEQPREKGGPGGGSEDRRCDASEQRLRLLGPQSGQVFRIQ
jgi:hypothetical protein